MSLREPPPIAADPPEVAREPAQVSNQMSSYQQILGSSALIGAATLLNIVFGVARTKGIALLLGPAGIGLIGLYALIGDLARSAAGMGINSSGVRQIAEAVASGDRTRIALTATVLRRVSWALGVLGAGILIALAPSASRVTFGDDRHAQGIALLSLAVLFRLVADGQGALLQGMRRIADLARTSVIGGLLGSIVAVAFVLLWGEAGVVPSLIVVATIAIATSTWYSRKLRIESAKLSLAEFRTEAGSLMKLGAAFMASGLLMLAAAYFVRVMLMRSIDLTAAGLYQAGWTVGGLYVGFVLQAMSADFYPRLVGLVTRRAACNRLVNEQTHASLLLAAPGILATITFAPVVIELFYTADFRAASGLLRWICVGMALRVITWPMGYIIVASGAQRIFFFTELAWACVNVGLTWLGIHLYGTVGAGMGFCASYVFHALLILPIANRMTGFSWSATNLRAGALFLGAIAVTAWAAYALPETQAMLVGAVMTVLSTAHSVRALLSLTSPDALPRSLRRLLIIGRASS